MKDFVLRRRSLLAASLGGLSACANQPLSTANADWIQGVVWQPDAATMDPYGSWHRLGARELLVQWFTARQADGTVLQTSAQWERLVREPWAREIILGLATDVDEPRARRDVESLIADSLALTRSALPLRPAAWYFPVEADPSWTDAPRLGAGLAVLPRPLWISVYDNSNVGPQALVAWLRGWLPSDVGVFFQDGVGLHTRTPAVAMQYLEALQQSLGETRVRLIAEAFRSVGQGLRSATADELMGQLAWYRKAPVHVFDGPHYVTPAMVEEMLATPAQR